MSMSVNNVISNYTYTYKSELRPILDRNADGSWSKEEVSNYAADYKSATGTALDVEAIFNKYDADGNASLEFSEYEQAAADDAFGMSLLSEKQSEAMSSLGAANSTLGSAANTQTSGTTESTEAGSEKTSTANMSEWLQSLSSSTRLSLVNTTVWADNMSSMLNAMLSASGSYNNINYGLMQYTNINAYASSIYKASSLSFNMSV